MESHNINPARLLDKYGVSDVHIKLLLCSRKTIIFTLHNRYNTIINVLQITNHYIGGNNYWEVVETSNSIKFYLAGNSVDELHYANSDIAYIINSIEYNAYIAKFNPYKVFKSYKILENLSYDIMPKPSKRDNKDVYVGGGGSNRTMVRFPRKKRGKSTWEKFWKLFPEYKGYKTYNDYIIGTMKKIQP